MKSFFKSIYCLMLEFGYARAASALAREGRMQEAKTLMLAKRECKCC
jgi:hypothetical protein